ncbi:hypothetical protein TrCOL_g1833 [Triparma columacea]|uniref:COMM domain-containing protein n=1 Tax=Triparma columacea TaxID=722753 RepID=A0A9W7G1T4_9STRA|nr:hypothetical protein TrCOL_g1833 [Triparma columacea]
MDILPTSNQSSLRVLSSIPESTFPKFVKCVFGMLTREEKYMGGGPIEGIEGDCGGKEITAKAHSALTSTIIAFVRTSSTSESFTQYLEDVPLPPPQIASVVSFYSQCYAPLRSLLSHTGTLPNLSNSSKDTMVGFDWRLDYRVRSSGTGENVPVFLCRFRVVDNGGNERVEEMEVGLSGMKDILYKVKQANKALQG